MINRIVVTAGFTVLLSACGDAGSGEMATQPGLPDASVTDPVSAQPATGAGVVRILPLGDSMTAGSEADPAGFRSFRGALYRRLVDAGVSVDFIGSQASIPAIGGDPDHAGYSGAWIGPGGSSNNLSDRLPAERVRPDPDIIILAMGWNSVYRESGVAGAKYRNFVTLIAREMPESQLVLATLSPQRGQTEQQSAAELPGYLDLNQVAREMANASQSDRLHLADLAAADFQASDYWDVIHWSQSGADRVATTLFQTLLNGPLRQ